MKVWDKEEKRREEKWRRMKIVVCTNLKQTSAKFGMTLWGVWGKTWEKYHAYKKDIWMSLYVSYHGFIND